MKTIRQYLRATDLLYLFLCILCSVLSVLTLVSIGKYVLGGLEIDELTQTVTGLGGYRYAAVQAGAALVGVLLAALISCIDYHDLAGIWPIHTVATVGFVLPTLLLHNLTLGPIVIGYSPEGTDNYSWYKIAGFTLQPAELLKISFILTFAMHLEQVRGHINEPKVLFRLLLHLLAPIALIHIQGDDGSAMVFGAIGAAMLFSAGLSMKYILAAMAAAGSAIGVAAAFFSSNLLNLKSYQLQRILVLFHMDDPEYRDVAMQQNQGKISIGAGQIFGRGLFSENHHYVANSFNDFLFSYLAESVGFVGCCIVVGLLLAIIFRTLTIGMRSKDTLGTYICTGIFGAMAWQTFINLGMNLAVLPVIGVTLPFFSGGGSSMLMLYLCVGLVLSVHLHNKKSLFEKT